VRTSKAYRISTDDLHQVLELVAEGHHLLEACGRLSLPYPSVWRKLSEDPELWALYQAAGEAFGDARAFRVSEEIRAEPDPKRAAVIANFERWVIESKARRGFGKVTKHEHVGEVALHTRSEQELMAMLQNELARLGISAEDFKALVSRKRKPPIEGTALPGPAGESPVADPGPQG
jgi:hypothetical protein